MVDVERVLKPANENPWYVLMTLYGEQDGEEIDWELHAKNRVAWNAWSCQAMDGETRATSAASSNVSVAELSAWPTLKAEVTALHLAEMLRRNGLDFTYLGLPEPADLMIMAHLNFIWPLVMQGAVFKWRTWFDSAIFNGGVRFDSATFNGEAWFGSAKFSGLASFGAGTFRERAWFPSTTFRGNANFSKTKFIEDTWFTSATFKARVHFPEAKFGKLEGQQKVNFIDSQFDQPTNFRDAVFHNSYPDFAGAVLHDKTTFTDHFDHWPKGKQIDPGQAKASCAAIRHNLGRQGLPEAEHFFFRREMGFSGQTGPWWQRPPYLVFGALSEYGYSIQRPVWWLLAVLLVPAFFFLNANRTCFCPEDLWRHGGEALGLSFSNVFNFLGFHKIFMAPHFMEDMAPWMKIVSGFQMIIGVVLLFFLGLGLRTRFRMR